VRRAGEALRSRTPPPAPDVAPIPTILPRGQVLSLTRRDRSIGIIAVWFGRVTRLDVFAELWHFYVWCG
jgi:hypothetical protein